MCGALLSIAVLLGAAPAAADDKALAETLAKEGEVLAGERKLDAACDKFAASLRLNRIAKVAYNLALCNKLRGKPATAWGQFVEASRIAKIEGDQTALSNAQQQADQLKPALPYILVQVPSPTEGLVVRLDEQQIAKEAWGVKVPVDPGDHTIVAEAPDHLAFTTHLTALRDAETREISLPALQPAPASESAKTTTSTGETDLETKATTEKETTTADKSAHGKQIASDRNDSSRTLAWVVGGTGAALVLGGLGAGLVAKTQYDDAKAQCKNGTLECPDAALEKEGSARTWAHVSTVVTGVGAAGVIAGVVLLVTLAPQRPAQVRSTRSFAPLVTTRDLGIVWTESF